jgi:hypothetical protein
MLRNRNATQCHGTGAGRVKKLCSQRPQHGFGENARLKHLEHPATKRAVPYFGDTVPSKVKPTRAPHSARKVP